MLFTLLTDVLYQLGFRYVVFTATRNVAAIIEKTHFTPTTLCIADPSKLTDGGECWGNYYDTEPRVMVGDLVLTARQARNQPLLRTLLSHFENDIANISARLRKDFDL